MKSKRVLWARHVARMGDKRNAFRIFMVKKDTTKKT
jgi:hypothetical protein